MNFDTYFKLTSYLVVACGALALLASEGISLFVTSVFVVTMLVAWRLEGSKWQISERLGLVLIIFSLPLFYLDWQFQVATMQARERAGAATLAHVILVLSLIKLWQKKGDRDWVFLYLISFFEILLAAGLSISPTFLAVLVLYLLCAACTVIAFEIRKAARSVKVIETDRAVQKKQTRLWRLSFASLGTLVLITFLAIPLFFAMPRVGGAGLGKGSGGLSGFVGFSDTVELGAIGKLQQSNQVVMRIRVEEPRAERNRNLRWRGVALDTFDNKKWSKSINSEKTPITPNKNGLFQFGTIERIEDLTEQNVYLEPIDVPNLFAAGRIVGLEGNFSVIGQDSENALYLNRPGGRVNYKAYSDTSHPEDNLLRNDNGAYPTYVNRYLQLPDRIDPRISQLARGLINDARALNRFDSAKAIEGHLQTEYGYTLEQKNGGTEQPLAKFLFDVREGHCEYFATAMVVMLRSQGIAARMVNGFQKGNYNDAADAYIITQAQAHSWVEVYFPETDSWITFDPTPAAGRSLGEGTSGNFIAERFNKYFEALEMFWMQYVVGYDNQEQRSLTRTLRNNFYNSQERLADFWLALKDRVSEWWKEARGEKGTAASWQAIIQGGIGFLGILLAVLLTWFAGKRLRHVQFWNIIKSWRNKNSAAQVVEFYERMTKALAKRGFRRTASQTPLEFAGALAMPEALRITEAYNRVRFGEQEISINEAGEIESWLRQMENNR